MKVTEDLTPSEKLPLQLQKEYAQLGYKLKDIREVESIAAKRTTSGKLEVRVLWTNKVKHIWEWRRITGTESRYIFASTNESR